MLQGSFTVLPTQKKQILDSSGIAFHGAAASGDVDIQQRLEEHLAHCALLMAVAQDATCGGTVAGKPQLPGQVHGRVRSKPAYKVVGVDNLLYVIHSHP